MAECQRGRDLDPKNHQSLMGIGLVYATTGMLNMADVGAAVAAGSVPETALLAAAALFLAGLGLKAAMMPVHAWLPDALHYLLRRRDEIPAFIPPDVSHGFAGSGGVVVLAFHAFPELEAIVFSH